MRLVWSAAALADLERFADFLHDRHPRIAALVADEIRRKTESLSAHPLLGRPVAGREEYRQVILRAVGADYVFLYRVSPDRVTVLRVFHAREAREEL